MGTRLKVEPEGWMWSEVITGAQIARRAFFPLDEQLELEDKPWSVGIVKQAVWLSGIADFELAGEIMREVGQVNISTTSLWRLSRKWGDKLKALEAQEQVQANQVASDQDSQTRREVQAGRMGVGMDGTMIHIRQEGWKELKVGCVFDVLTLPTLDSQTKEWVDLGHALHSSYTCHLGGPEVFGEKVWTEAKRRGWLRASETQVVADGAVWIWNLVMDTFYDSHQVVDWFHAKEHLVKVAYLLYGEGTPAAQRWLHEMENALFQGHADKIALEISQVAQDQKSATQESALTEAGYFENNKRRMNYLDLRSEGWVIGSGMVESGGKQFKARFAGPGMHWSRPGAESLLPIRSAVMSKRFDERWRAASCSPIF